MAAELVGGALLSSLFETLFRKLTSQEYVKCFRQLNINERLLKNLKTMLWSANQVLDDAEEKQLTNPAVREWLFELKETICDAEDVLDEINYRTLQYEQKTKSRNRISKRLQLLMSTPFHMFDKAIERMIKEIFERLKYILNQKDVLGLKECVKHGLSQRLPAPLLEESCVYGRNVDRENIIKLLLSDGGNPDKITVIPIVGMGGIGKTTLAQLVYEDTRVKNHFDMKSWVTVSDERDIFKLTKHILEEITSQKCENESLYQLQSKLKEALRGKKFLFVHDDVWNQCYEHWDSLKSPFNSGARGSKIIVTTRNEIVATRMGNVPTYCLETVTDDDCWRLFAEHAFKNVSSNSYQDLHHVIGRQVVKKCKGLPLAVKSLAGLLRSVSDLEEWKRILESHVWELQLQGNQSNIILPSLWLSYQYLPSHLKRCFSYCSIFPKGYAIKAYERKKIILLWMAEGLLQPAQNGKRMEDIGDEYFEDLISRSLFQRSSKDKSTILMHDLVHDLAVFVSGEFCFRLDDNDKTKFSSKTRHFSYSKLDDLQSFICLSTAKSLRTLVSCTGYSTQLSLSKLLPPGGCLRALCLSRYHFKKLPDTIGDLKKLRYLDLSWNDIKEIPDTICDLYNLQTLRLSHCWNLSQLPNGMGNLVNLRHLEIMDVPLEKMPPKMCNMKDLQTLTKFVIGENNGSTIKELGGLHYLSGKLEISELQNVTDVGDVWEANLQDKKYLSAVRMCWCSLHRGYDDSEKDKEVLDALRPHINVKELVIRDYKGTRFSHWVGHHSYANMVAVRLSYCDNFAFLPPLGQLPSLEKLEISRCHGVMRIGDGFYGNGTSGTKPFGSLKCLKFECMQEWQEWSFPRGQEDGSCFPSLKYLYIWNCPKLNVCLPDHFPSLKTLELRKCEHLRVFPRTQQMDVAFPSLELMFVEDCPRLESFLLRNIPSSIMKLHISDHRSCAPHRERSLHPQMEIRGCQDVVTFPEGLLPTTLTSLCIVGIPHLKALDGKGFQHLTSLKELRIEDCKELQSIPEEGLPISLLSIVIKDVANLRDLGNGFQHLRSLKKMDISICRKLESFPELGLPASLTSLHISRHPNLKHLGKTFQHLISLEELYIGSCENLQCLPEGLPTSLKTLRLSMLPNLRNLARNFQGLISLEELHISSCENLQYCSFKENGKGLQDLISLKKLDIWYCENLQNLLESGLPTSLTSLHISSFPNLEDLNLINLQHLISLEELYIGNCKKLRWLPEEGLPSSLSYLSIYKCPLLVARCQREKGEDWPTIADIPCLEIEE